jgi:hypothetical protein
MYETGQLKKGKGVIIMNQNESDQIWQQLRFYMEKIFNQPLENDVRKIEYKPRYIALLEMSSENPQSER